MSNAAILVDQTTPRTTRKVAAAAWASSAAALTVGVAVKYILPEMDDPIYTSAMTVVVEPVFVGIAAWWAGYQVRNRAHPVEAVVLDVKP